MDSVHIDRYNSIVLQTLQKRFSCRRYLPDCPDRSRMEVLEEAVRLDPGFLLAWSKLSQHHSAWYNNGLDKTEARLAKARAFSLGDSAATCARRSQP